MTGSVWDDVHSPSTPRIPRDHGRHDRLLVTRFAADDAYPTEVAEAQALVDGCPACASLVADIRLLRASTADLPRPRRPRDFRLTPEVAQDLRGTALTRVLRRIAAPGLAPLRPVAGVALSLGVALAVVGTVLPGAAPVDENSAFRTMEAAAGDEAPQAAPDGQPDVGAPGGEMPRDGAAGQEGEALEGEEPTSLGAGDFDVLVEGPADSGIPRDLLIYAGLLMAMLSFAVLVLVTLARRRWRDPLLR